MPRKGHLVKREVMPDAIYGSKVVTKLINFIEKIENSLIKISLNVNQPVFLSVATFFTSLTFLSENPEYLRELLHYLFYH